MYKLSAMKEGTKERNNIGEMCKQIATFAYLGSTW